MNTVNLYRAQQLAISAAIDSGDYGKASDLLRQDLQTFAPPEQSTETGDKRALTAPTKCGIIKMIRRHVRRWKKQQEEKTMEKKFIELYSIDNCAPSAKTKVLAKPDDSGDFIIDRAAFLRACKKLGSDEHSVRCSENVYTYTGRAEGNQMYNLRDGIRPQSW